MFRFQQQTQAFTLHTSEYFTKYHAYTLCLGIQYYGFFKSWSRCREDVLTQLYVVLQYECNEFSTLFSKLLSLASWALIFAFSPISSTQVEISWQVWVIVINGKVTRFRLDSICNRFFNHYTTILYMFSTDIYKVYY